MNKCEGERKGQQGILRTRWSERLLIGRDGRADERPCRERAAEHTAADGFEAVVLTGYV